MGEVGEVGELGDGITITRVFEVPRQLVFEAWTQPKHFAHWFGGPGTHVPDESVSMDVRPGGRWKATMVIPEDERSIDWTGRYVEVEPPERLVLTLSDVPVADDDTDESVTVVLTEIKGGTQMVFHQGGGHLTPEQYEATKAGWESFFERLNTHLLASA